MVTDGKWRDSDNGVKRIQLLTQQQLVYADTQHAVRVRRARGLVELTVESLDGLEFRVVPRRRRVRQRQVDVVVSREVSC